MWTYSCPNALLNPNPCFFLFIIFFFASSPLLHKNFIPSFYLLPHTLKLDPTLSKFNNTFHIPYYTLKTFHFLTPQSPRPSYHFLFILSSPLIANLSTFAIITIQQYHIILFGISLYILFTIQNQNYQLILYLYAFIKSTQYTTLTQYSSLPMCNYIDTYVYIPQSSPIAW